MSNPTDVHEKLKQRIPASFPVRHMDYQFKDVPKYWCNNDAIFTHYFTAMSTLFPEGESYFVRSVRTLRSKLKNNSKLDRDIGAFIGQEAMHSKEHQAFHQSAQQHGLDPKSLENSVGIVLKTIEKIFPEKWNLLMTVGIEHYTAVLVVYMMEEVNLLMTDDNVRNLWLWHSVEETEHKAVAFDLYQELYGKKLDAYIPRVTLYTFSLLLITTLSTFLHLILVKRDGQLFNLNSWKKFIVFGYKSYSIFIPKFMAYYRIDFHPNDTNETILVKATKEKINLNNKNNLLI